jgi:hypothetical protein
MIEIDGIIWRQSPVGDWWETIGYKNGNFKVPGAFIDCRCAWIFGTLSIGDWFLGI